MGFLDFLSFLSFFLLLSLLWLSEDFFLLTDLSFVSACLVFAPFPVVDSLLWRLVAFAFSSGLEDLSIPFLGFSCFFDFPFVVSSVSLLFFLVDRESFLGFLAGGSLALLLLRVDCFFLFFVVVFFFGFSLDELLDREAC